MTEEEKMLALIESGDEEGLKTGTAVMLTAAVMAAAAAITSALGVVLARLLT